MVALASPAKSIARVGVRGWGTATSARRPLPDFVIVGAKRGGTTTMFRSLQAHPQVLGLYPASQGKKSPHYFDLEHHRGPRWYRSFFPTEAARTAGGGPRRLVGEASPYYLFHPHAPSRIADELPDAKLVVMLRNPVDRAFSHHWDRVKNGVETESFEEAIRLEPERLAGERQAMLVDPTYQSHAYEHFSYLARGNYAAQLEHLFAVVDRERVLVLQSEPFYADPQAGYEQVLAFLGLPHHAPAEFGKLHGHADRPSVAPETRARLDEHFAPSDAALARLLETDPWW